MFFLSPLLLLFRRLLAFSLAYCKKDIVIHLLPTNCHLNGAPEPLNICTQKNVDVYTMQHNFMMMLVCFFVLAFSSVFFLEKEDFFLTLLVHRLLFL